MSQSQLPATGNSSRGSGPGRVLAVYGCAVLVVGVIVLVGSPVAGFTLIFALLYPSQNSTILLEVGAGVVGLGAVVVLLWVIGQRMEGATVGKRIVPSATVVGLACLATLWVIARPAGNASNDASLGRFRNVDTVVTDVVSPRALGADGQGVLYVFDSADDHLAKISSAGATLGTVKPFVSSPLIDAIGIAPEGESYIDLGGFPAVIRRIAISGRQRSTWTASTNDGLIIYDALAISRQGVVYLGGTLAPQRQGATNYPFVREYSRSGRPLRVWHGKIENATRIGMAVDETGNLYIGDEAGNRLQSFTPSGRLRWTWTMTNAYTARASDFPPGVAVNRVGNVYVAGNSTNRVIQISPSGHRLSSWRVPPGPHDTPTQPSSLAVDEQGSVYLLDAANGRIFKYSSSGRPLAVFK